MGNLKSKQAEVNEIFSLLDADGSKTLNWTEVEYLTFCTPLAERLNEMKTSSRDKLKWNRKDLIQFFSDLKVREEEITMILKILRLKGLPNKIFNLLDDDGNGFVIGNTFTAYLVSLKGKIKWIADKVDLTMAAVMQFQSPNSGNLTAAFFAKCLITGGFNENQLQQLYQHVKETHETADIAPPDIKPSVDKNDVVVGFNADVRDKVGQWNVGEVIKKSKSRVKVHFLKYKAKFDEWIDLNTEITRFAEFQSLSNQAVYCKKYKISQRVMIWASSPAPCRWRNGVVTRMLGKQVRVEYLVCRKRYYQWAHEESSELQNKSSSRQSKSRGSEGKGSDGEGSASETQTRTTDGKWWVGQIIEVLDTVGKWEPAETLRIRGNELFVHYVNWTSKWDEWLDVIRCAHKIRPLGAALVETEQERMTKKAEADFRKGLEEKFGYKVENMNADGNCLFRSFAFQIYGDQERHMDVREACYNYLEAERSTFGVFLAEPFEEYIKKMKQKNKWGGHVEIAVLREMFSVNVEIFHRGEVLTPRPIGGATDKLPIVRLSYHGKCHYNSVVDPKSPPPFGDAKKRKINLKELRKNQEAKSRDGQHLKTPKLLREISREHLRRGSVDTNLLTPKDNTKSNLSDFDYGIICAKFVTQNSHSLAVEDIPKVVAVIMDKLFAKKIAARSDIKESLMKLKNELDDEADRFVEDAPRSLEIVDGKMDFEVLIKAYKTDLLPKLEWRLNPLMMSKPSPADQFRRPEAKVDAKVEETKKEPTQGDAEQQEKTEKAKEEGKEEQKQEQNKEEQSKEEENVGVKPADTNEEESANPE